MSFSSTSTFDECAELSTSERTLALIKPEAIENKEQIMQIIENNGYIILAKRCVRLSPEQAAEFYRCHYGKQYFPHLVAHMSNSTIFAMVLAKHNCIEDWKVLMGPPRVQEAQAYWPESLRAGFGRRSELSDYFNGIHGSSCLAEAIREIHFFFPNMVVGPILKKWQVDDYINHNIYPLLLKGLTELVKLKPNEPIMWLANWLIENNPNRPLFSNNDEDDPAAKSKCETPPPSVLSA